MAIVWRYPFLHLKSGKFSADALSRYVATRVLFGTMATVAGAGRCVELSYGEVAEPRWRPLRARRVKRCAERMATVEGAGRCVELSGGEVAEPR